MVYLITSNMDNDKGKPREIEGRKATGPKKFVIVRVRM